MNFIRQKYKEKPQAWGSFGSVQRSLFINAEKIGINPAYISLAMPMWNGGKQVDYSKNRFIGTNYGAIFNQNALSFNASNTEYLSIDAPDTQFLGALTIISRVYLNATNPSIYHHFAGKHTGNGALNNPFDFRTSSTSSTHKLSFVRAAQYQQYTYSVYEGGYIETKKIYNCAVRITDGYTRTVPSFFVNTLQTQTNIIKYGELYTATGTNAPILIGKRDDNEVRTNGIIYYTLIFSTALKNSQISILSDNPYQLWQRQPDVYFSIPVSAGNNIYFLLSPLNATITSDINSSILRSIITNISNASNASDISISISQLISLLLSMSNSTDCSDIAQTISRALRIDLSNSSDTSLVIQNITRNINASFANQTTTSALVHNITRLFVALISNNSSTSDITVNLNNLVSLIMTMSNQSVTSDIQASITRLLQLAILNNTNQSNIAISILRSLSATINNQTVTNDIELLLANLIQFGMTLSNSTAISDIVARITRGLNVNSANTTYISDIDYSISRAFITNISNQTDLSEIDTQILRSLSATITNSTVTPDTLRLIMGVIGSLINLSSVVSANQYTGSISSQSYSANISTNIYTGVISNG